MKVFSLVYLVRPHKVNCLPILSETVHGSFEEAILKLWHHVAGDGERTGQIEELYLDDFIEAIGDNLFDIRLFDFTGDDDEPITTEELNKLFASTSLETKKEVIDWYFELVNDETTEASYRILEHKLNQQADASDEENGEVFTATLKQISSEQMDKIKQRFSWSEHPLDSKEIIVEIQEGDESRLNEIIPDFDVVGLVVFHT